LGFPQPGFTNPASPPHPVNMEGAVPDYPELLLGYHLVTQPDKRVDVEVKVHHPAQRCLESPALLRDIWAVE
jgi:hypothetical protein